MRRPARWGRPGHVRARFPWRRSSLEMIGGSAERTSLDHLTD
ncbi:hypothetical protein HMPREF1549_02986 [Actinomyces johnsonii F0510]|uniref:Uncharacterized protein n=1 Tax=Actinomyces johnsonii F0510 TaxID=1227262 RepID=U1R7U9_9ACTO|nr:hypothetical protein HMPREF1549_02986 [Actinomyces johnsonii F0510]